MENQDEYKGLSGLRSGVAVISPKAASTGQVPIGVRPGRASSSDMYPKRAEGKVRCSICLGWGHAGPHISTMFSVCTVVRLDMPPTCVGKNERGMYANL